MNEVLATHENIENNEALSSDELRALQAINNFFDKNIDTDHILKEDLEQENSDISSDVLDAYNTLKDDIMFVDAYATQEYQLHRSSVIDYLTNNFGRTNQEAGGKYFSTLNPMTLQAKLGDYNKAFPEKDVIDIGKFMTNFHAEKIQNAMSIQTIDREVPEIADYNKDQEHIIGKIFEVPAEEKAHIQNLVKYIHEDHGFVLEIFGQADGTPVVNPPESIKNKYNALREELMEGCDKTIQSNINKVFPEFDTEHYPEDKWNIAFAQARAMSKVSYLSAEDKNMLFAGNYTSSGDSLHVIGNTTRSFRTVKEIGHEHTKGSVDIKPSIEKRSKEIVEYRENYLQNIGLNAIGVTISGTTPRYKGKEIITHLKTNELITADFKFNKKSDRKTPLEEPMGFIDDHGLNQTTQSIYGKSSDSTLHINVSYDSIENGDYDQFFSYEETPDGKINNIKLKPISFKDALILFKKLNPGENAQKYANNVEASLNNFDLLTAALKDDKELTIGVAKELIKRPAFTSETYKEKPEYKTLQELGIYTKESEIKQSKEGKNIGQKVILFYINDDNGDKTLIASRNL